MFTNLAAAAVAVATTDAVASLDVATCRTLGVQVSNTGANALDAFEVWGQTSPTAALVKLSGVASDYTTPAYPVVKASASPVTLAAGATMWMAIDVSAFAGIELRASSAVGATTLEIHACRKSLL